MILNLWKARSARRVKAEALYRAIVRQTRRPEFYRAGGVADTFEGRFDLLVVHLALVLRRLKGEGAHEKAVAQLLLDLFFADMDAALRELGVGDSGVGRRVRRMSEAFYGRLEAYDAGLSSADDEALRAALIRNLYDGKAAASGRAGVMVRYLREAARHLERIGSDKIDEGTAHTLFPEPPAFDGAGSGQPAEEVR